MIVQCDFDGTIITCNMGVLLRETFVGEAYHAIERQYQAGLISVEQGNQRHFALIKAPRARLEAFVRAHAAARPGFTDFLEYCRRCGLRFVIVSSGLDFYIRPALHAIGTPQVELYCGQATFTGNGISLTYRDPQGNVIDRGFKRRYLEWFREAGRPVVYIGDGLSDVEPATRADHVLATGSLPRLLEEQGIPYQPFQDFHDIRRHLEKLVPPA